MKKSLKTGINFGVISGIITTLGLIIGLAFGTGSKIAVIGGILTIAFADALSDALGIHISEESKTSNSKNIWTATLSTFASKAFFSLTFLIPVILFNLLTATIISIIYAVIVIGVISYIISKKSKYKTILEHELIAVIVIIATFFIGKAVSLLF